MSSHTATLAPTLQRLYFARFGFALVWAGLLFTSASELGPVSIALLVLYPLFDVAAAVIDLRSAQDSKPASGLYVNIAISAIAGIGLVFAAASGIPAVLRVWGAWAIVSGLVQLAVGIGRRELGGQWAMIASGAISALAGTSFVLQAAQPDATLLNLAGYAFLGGVFFLVSAIRLGRLSARG